MVPSFHFLTVADLPLKPKTCTMKNVWDGFIGKIADIEGSFVARAFFDRQKERWAYIRRTDGVGRG
jgi:hypothetical protein